MSEDEPEDAFFPPCYVERIGNVVMIQCEKEDDAIVIFEIFRDVALGKSVSFKRSGTQ